MTEIRVGKIFRFKHIFVFAAFEDKPFVNQQSLLSRNITLHLQIIQQPTTSNLKKLFESYNIKLNQFVSHYIKRNTSSQVLNQETALGLKLQSSSRRLLSQQFKLLRP